MRPAVASAQDRTAHDRAAARALFHEGVGCAGGEDWTCAADRFARAYALRPSPVIASNLGHALVHLGRFVEAAEMLGEVVRGAAATEQLRADANATLAEIAPQLGRLTVRVVGSTSGVALTMDGQEYPESLLGIAGPSDPGDHALEARREGQVVATASVHVDPGAAAEVELAIPAPVVEPVVVDPDLALRDAEASLVAAPRGPEVYEEWWFWTVIGVVVVGAVGVTVGVLATPSSASLPAGSLGTIDGR